MKTPHREEGLAIPACQHQDCSAINDGQGAHDLAVVRLPENRAARLAECLVLPLRLALLSRAARKQPGRLAYFGCYPSLDTPSLIYELHTAASKYAERYLLPAQGMWYVPSCPRAALCAWAGCDPAIGAVILATDGGIHAMERLLTRLLPDRLHGGRVSLAWLNTTRPAFLAFVENSRWPSCVAQIGRTSEMVPLHRLLSSIHYALPDLVPDALLIETCGASQSVLVQEGMPGVPWFALRRHLLGVKPWLELRARALAVLARLHNAILGLPDGEVRLNLGIELERQYVLCETAGIFPVARRASMQEAIAGVVPLGEMTSCSQHGDFCLNNLVVDRERVSVIDFEEAGQTAVPLHDELSLALSFHDFMIGVRGAPSLMDHIDACTAESCHREPVLAAHRRALLVHHLLWRINQCQTRPNRGPMKAKLVGLLDRTLRYDSIEAAV